MGQLIAKKYPTKLFLKAADHTYVECGSGAKAWACWGGKSGGTAFNGGSGSTARADAIAQPDERANITCYLINGVCHQAANRILLPAGILVVGAKGYSVSQAIFGAYGKSVIGPCHGNFVQYPDVSGDLEQCASALSLQSVPAPTAKQAQRQGAARSRLLTLHKRAANATDALESMQVHASAFERQVSTALAADPSPTLSAGLRQAKVNADMEHLRLCQNFALQETDAVAFVKDFNRMTLDFQDNMANAMNKTQYLKVFDTTPDERIYLADPEILDEVFGPGTALAVYGDNLQPR